MTWLHSLTRLAAFQMLGLRAGPVSPEQCSEDDAAETDVQRDDDKERDALLFRYAQTRLPVGWL